MTSNPSIRKMLSLSKYNRPELSRSKRILKYTHQSAESFLSAYDGVHGSSNQQVKQDLLRAMLAFTSAGLDSLTKQLIRDTLPLLTNKNEKSRQGLETFISRQLRRDDENSSDLAGASKFLSRVLAADSYKDQVIKEYIDFLTGKSLQSPEELMRAAFSLGIEPIECSIDPQLLRPIFDIRNKIIHELDIDFLVPNGHRKIRERNEMVDYTNKILEIGDEMLIHVAKIII